MSVVRDFKDFILRGNVVDLAIGIVIGIAFAAVVTAFVSDILTPLITIPGRVTFANIYVQIGGGKFLIGQFLNTVLAFLLIAVAVFFFVVKPVNALMARRKKETPATTRDCPYCVQSVPLGATRCPYCTSDLEPVPVPAPVRAEPAGVAASPAERERRLRARYGGFSWSATFSGFAVASILTLVFLAIVGAIIGGIGYQVGARAPAMGGALSDTSRNLGIGGLVGALLAVALAYGLGGYTAGRMVRFDGMKNGLGVALWAIAVGIILGLVGAVLGTRTNLISHLHLPGTMPTLAISGVIWLAITLLVMLLASALGGRRGADYHRKIDRDAGPQEEQQPAA